MKRRVTIGLACLLLLAGWLGSFLLNSMATGYGLFILGPTLLLATGLGMIWKAAGGRLAAVALAFTALFALLTINQFYPERALSVSALKNRIQAKGQSDEAKNGSPIFVVMPAAADSPVFPPGFQLEAFSDIRVSLFSTLPGPPQRLAFDSRGRLFVTLPRLGAVYMVPLQDGRTFGGQPVLFAAGLDRPSGLVWNGARLFVAEPGRLLELHDSDGDDQIDRIRVVLDDLPDDGGHWIRPLTFVPGGSLYLAIGSRCDACEEKDQKRGTILEIDPESGDARIFARGVRNAGGLVLSPGDNHLWVSDNSREGGGDVVPPDEINRVQAGGDYGWPYCYGNQVPDLPLGTTDHCKGTLASALDLFSQANPGGLTFGNGLVAPRQFQESLYVVLRGGLSAGSPPGGRLVRIPWRGGSPAGPPQEFLRGWQQGKSVLGRPVDLVLGPDGALYLSDEETKAIYRIDWPADGDAG